MRQADALGAEYAAVIGRRELAEGAAALRRLADGHQETVPLADVAGRLGDGAVVGATFRRCRCLTSTPTLSARQPISGGTQRRTSLHSAATPVSRPQLRDSSRSPHSPSPARGRGSTRRVGVRAPRAIITSGPHSGGLLASGMTRTMPRAFMLGCERYGNAGQTCRR